MIRHGRHIVDGKLLLPAWACWVFDQHLEVDRLRELSYLEEDLELVEILTDLRTVALHGRAELIAQAESKPVTNVAESRNSSHHSQMFDVDEAAKRLGMKQPAVRKAARDGRLDGTKAGKRGDWFFTLAEVEAFAASRSH